MGSFLAQTQPWENTWNAPAGSNKFMMQILIGLVLSAVLFFAVMKAPTRARRSIIGAFTFLAGAVYAINYLWPKTPKIDPLDKPTQMVDKVSFFLSDGVTLMGDVANVVAAFLLGIGVFSLLNVHFLRIVTRHPDRVFSVILLVSMFLMSFYGFMDWRMREFTPTGVKLEDPANWGHIQYGSDLLFFGLYQQMEAAMFSIIAFFIMSAAYRAFRIRSIESTILLAAAFIMMLSLLSLFTGWWDHEFITADKSSFLNNFRIVEVAGWIKANLQGPSIRAMDMGVGIGALAMGLRLWLGIERGGVSA
jgi:hypothetical protein